MIFKWTDFSVSLSKRHLLYTKHFSLSSLFSSAMASSGSFQTEEKHSKEQSSIEKVVIDGVSYSKVKEGKAEILFPAVQGVFYNPVQQFNRDLSISIIRTFQEDYQRKTKKKPTRKLSVSSNNSSKSENTNNSNSKDHCNKSSDHSSETAGVTENSSSDKENGTDSTLEHNKTGLRILESLAASGLRSIRYSKEIKGVKEITANDFSHFAVECMKRNIDYNKVGDLVFPSEQDASLLHYMHRAPDKQFDVIDLDPYGSPSQFLDGAVQALADGGLLLVTCTDMGVLCGNSPDTCYAKYGATSLKTKACHEFALRIALQSLQAHASRYGRYIKPLISTSADFYIRIAVRVFQSQQKVKESYTKVGYVTRCVGCDTLAPQPLGNIIINGPSVRHRLPHVEGGERCPHCKSRMEVAGPVWLDPIHDYTFLKQLLATVSGEDSPHFYEPLGTQRRLEGTISMMLEELEDVPLYHVFDSLCAVVGIMPCKMEVFASAILNAGYRYSMSHCKKNSIKTDAPASVIWDIIRAREKLFPALKMRARKDSPGFALISAESNTQVDFSLHPLANPESKKKELLRFQVNPEKFWGPLTRSTTKVLGNSQQQEKSLRNQGKNAHKMIARLKKSKEQEKDLDNSMKVKKSKEQEEDLDNSIKEEQERKRQRLATD